MQNLNKFLVTLLIICSIFGLAGPIVAAAATAPTWVGAYGYSILGGAAITNTGATTVTGDVGVSPGSSIGGGITGGTQHSNDGSAITAQTDATNVFNSLNQTCDHGPVGPTDLAGAVLTPGVYCYSSSVQISVGGVLHLDAQGDPNAVWIFKVGSTLTTISGASVVFDNVGSACNVFWQVGSSATLGTTTHFIGNIIAADDITLLTNATVNGRILARGVSADGTVALDTNTISGPTCNSSPTLTLVKTVVGGTKTFADFPLTATGPTTITGASASSAVTSATVTAGLYTLSEGAQVNYTAGTWSCTKNPGAVVTSGPSITLASGDSAICTIQNTYVAPSGGGGGNSAVPPLIDVSKVPSPLALPAGPGSVTYTYTLKNIGTVPVTNINMKDDSCSPVTLISGDINTDNRLDVNETWTYACTTTLSATHTNTITATGWANGISATDISTATVVVGEPTVPPLIHVTKIPSPLALSAGGGIVTYTEKVTNPGTVALNNVQITDDKCNSVKYVSGDTNNDSKLDPSETWTYTCQTNLTSTTTNTVTASGQANGLTARDFAIATVVVAQPVVVTPTLPNTGFSPENKNILWNVAMLVGILMLISTSVLVIVKKRGA